MSVYKRGGTWWYEFVFQGIRVRESARTGQKEIAARAERERRRNLELGGNVLEEVKRPRMFSLVAKAWLAGNPHWSANTLRINSALCRRLVPVLGGLLLTDIRPAQIARYQSQRLAEGASPRTVNMELVALRQILRDAGLWAPLQGKMKWLRVEEEKGRALTHDEMQRLSAAVAKTRGRSLPYALTVLASTGLRLSELRTMRWSQVNLIGDAGMPPHLRVGKAKTRGSEGRMVPLAGVGLAAMLEWRAKFPLAKAQHFVFPSERYGFDGSGGLRDGGVTVYNTDPTKPIGSWKTAWTTARKASGVQCRTHDLRHTFASRLGEQGTPEVTMLSLMGHMSRKMLELYSHTRVQAKVKAIESLDAYSPAGYPQNPPQRPN